MANLHTIERLAFSVKQSRAVLQGRMKAYKEAIAEIDEQHLTGILEAAVASRKDVANLSKMIDGNRVLFEKPKSHVFHDIRCGLRKQAGKVIIEDEEKTIGLIRKLLPKDQIELLISVTESVYKPSVSDLTAKDLKRLAIRIEDDTDAVMIKFPNSDIEKAVAALLKDAEGIQAA